MEPPVFKEGFESERLLSELAKLNQNLKLIHSKLERSKFLVSSQYVFQYLADYCGGLISMSYKFNDFEKIFPDHPDKAQQSVKMKTFPDYLILPSNNGCLKKDQEKLAEICKNLFNANHSPKEYAVMLCLLSEKNLVSVPSKRRKDFFLSWYSFIDQPPPSNHNFSVINRFIADKGSSFIFKDEADGDFRNLKNIFFKSLITNNIIS